MKGENKGSSKEVEIVIFNTPVPVKERTKDNVGGSCFTMDRVSSTNLYKPLILFHDLEKICSRVNYEYC